MVRLLIRVSGFILLLVGLSRCTGSPSILAPEGPDASRIASLSWLMFGIAALVFALVTTLLFVAFLRKHPEETDIPIQANDRSALGLTIVAGVIIPGLVLVAVTVLGLIIENTGTTAGDPNVTVDVIGHMWWWEVRYPGQNVVTANEIHIPTGQPVLFHLTSNDVNHSFWVPQLHGKLDLIPGQTNTYTLQADASGVYRGMCAEYCGLQHAHMNFLVIADAPADFEKWLAEEQQTAPDPDASEPDLLEGQQAVLGSSCVYCHTIRGTNASGTLGPDLTHLASRQTLAAGVLTNNRGNLAGWIVNSQTTKPGNLMPPMDVDPQQLQSMLDYLESLQ